MDLARMLDLSGEELSRQLENGNCPAFQQAIEKATEDEKAQLRVAAYALLQRRGIYRRDLISEIISHPSAGISQRFWADFQKAPAYSFPPPEQITWATGDKFLGSARYLLADAVIRIDDSSALEEMWRAFPALSADDQFIVSYALARGNVRQIPAAVGVLEAAKTLHNREQLKGSALTMYREAQKEPGQAAAVAEVRQRLEVLGGDARFLLEAKPDADNAEKQ